MVYSLLFLEPIRLHLRSNHMTAPRIADPKHQAQLRVALTDDRFPAELHVRRMPWRTNHFGVHDPDHGALDGNADHNLDHHQEYGFGAFLVRVLLTETDGDLLDGKDIVM